MGDEEKKTEVKPLASSNEEKKPDPVKPPEQPPTPNTNSHPLVEKLAEELRALKDEKTKMQERLDKLDPPPKKAGIFKPGLLKGRPPGRKS